MCITNYEKVQISKSKPKKFSRLCTFKAKISEKKPIFFASKRKKNRLIFAYFRFKRKWAAHPRIHLDEWTTSRCDWTVIDWCENNSTFLKNRNFFTCRAHLLLSYTIFFAKICQNLMSYFHKNCLFVFHMADKVLPCNKLKEKSTFVNLR